MVEQSGSSLWVLSVDHDTRMEHVVEVDHSSFEILNRHLLTEQEADATSVMSSERHPFMKDGELSDIQLDELNQWYGHEFTKKETSIGTVLPQYRDQGVRFDRLRNSYVQNNDLFHRHLIASEQEFEVTANAMGKLYYAFCKQDVVGRDELDCLPSARTAAVAARTAANAAAHAASTAAAALDAVAAGHNGAVPAYQLQQEIANANNIVAVAIAAANESNEPYKQKQRRNSRQLFNCHSWYTSYFVVMSHMEM